jgi:hypothetical protein
MGRIATLLSPNNNDQKEEQACSGIINPQQQSPSSSQYLNAAGWRACLLAALGACFCPVPGLWPALWPLRRAQRQQIRAQYPHFPSRAPSSTSSTATSTSNGSSCYCSCLPCALAEEAAFLERAVVAARRQGEEQEWSSSKGKARKGRAESPPPWEPEAGWDMRPIVDVVVEDGQDQEDGLANG